ncbi:MAG: hypothetical protein JXO22_09955 [Phycisphaerae bacterium]|nr:hypothetical protein [Phycisphaerae bacterium]
MFPITQVLTRMAWLAVLGLAACATGCASGSAGLVAGQGASGPWWMQQTAIARDGQLDLAGKPWWPRASQLNVGEQFVIEAESTPARPEAGLMLVRKENCPLRNGKTVEAIVWVIDDDADGSLDEGGDTDSDCYIADYGCDGTADRMVDYIDNDGDNDPDEMDIRYFVDGRLRYTWFGMDLDDDSTMWSLTGYEYGGPSFFEADPYGDSMIYMNKLNTDRGTWAPISECPFAFYDTDADGESEVVVRISAVPINYDTGVDPDYANDYSRFQAEWNPEMARMGAVNIRYSFDVDNLSGPEMPLHYDFGFNLVGAVPYEFAGMHHFNAKRRPPQVTCVTPFHSLRGICDRYPASETGFSWHEHHDDTIAIGYGPHAKSDYRWEGVFWMWERRFMGNTGGPCQKWNVRREWTDKPTDRRELYYSGVDRRIHLFGAQEGWIEIGHFAGQDALGEIRMFDTNGNGYFDRWEVYRAGESVPVRVSAVQDEKARRIPFDYERLCAVYTERILPEAMAANDRLMAAMAELHDFDVPAGLAEAMQSGSANDRRFAQDVAREMQYQVLRRELNGKANCLLAAAKKDDLRPLKGDERETTVNSHYAWRLIRALSELDVAYGQGDFATACAKLGEIAGIEESVNP